uniref:Uncharacterized protein n=1 Tax=Arundo donax TaxID=35708 RepID=A0A0A8YDB6_ARUDO
MGILNFTQLNFTTLSLNYFIYLRSDKLYSLPY